MFYDSLILYDVVSESVSAYYILNMNILPKGDILTFNFLIKKNFFGPAEWRVG